MAKCNIINKEATVISFIALGISILFFLVSTRQVYLSPFSTARTKREHSRIRWLNFYFATINLIFAICGTRLRVYDDLCTDADDSLVEYVYVFVCVVFCIDDKQRYIDS